MVRTAVRTTPLRVAVMVTGVASATGKVMMAKSPMVVP
jgi:hypothetical protein